MSVTLSLAPVLAPTQAPTQAPPDATPEAAGFGQLLAQQMRTPEPQASTQPGTQPGTQPDTPAEEDTEASVVTPAEAPAMLTHDHGLALALGLLPLPPLGSQVSALARDPLAREALAAALPGNGLALGQRALATGSGPGQGRGLPHSAAGPATLAAEPAVPATSLLAPGDPAAIATAAGDAPQTDQAATLPSRAGSVGVPVAPAFGAMLQDMAQSVTQGTAAQPEPAATTLRAPIGHPAWNEELGATLSWMASGKTQVAQLHLNPAELGPVSVTLTLQQDQAQAQFASAQPLVREAIEAALPRLREMLAESGITLGQASVDAHAPKHQADGQRAQAEGGRHGTDHPSDTGRPAPAQPLRTALGLVDTFA